MTKILQPGQSYTFSNYFQMSFPVEEILKELNYNYISQKLELPVVEGASQFGKNRREVEIYSRVIIANKFGDKSALCEN